MLNSKTICLAFGYVFVLVGIVGFIPNPIVSSDGIFETNAIHNLVHLLTGTAFLVGASVFKGKEGPDPQSHHHGLFWGGHVGIFHRRQHALRHGAH